MAMDLNGINNRNEYYTNHYFTSLFESNASDTISAWKSVAKANETLAPWQKLREVGKKYHQARDRYLNSRDGKETELVSELAYEYLDALGYCDIHSSCVEVAENTIVPVFHEVCKNNGAPLLWVVLSKKNEIDDSVLQSSCFDSDDEENGDISPLINDELLSKIFFAGEEAPRWVVLIGIDEIALIDRNKWSEKRFLTFDLDTIYQRHEETTFQAMSVLLHMESLCPEEGSSLLDSFDENSHKNSASVSDELKWSLRECIELLGNEVIYDMKNRQGIDLDENPVDAGELTAECLRYMYRMLFMLFIEARYEQLGFSAMKAQSYKQGYSLEGLRDIAENVRDDSDEIGENYYLGDTLAKLYEMVYTGYPKDAEVLKALQKNESTKDIFVIEPMKAHIFDPQYTQLIAKSRLRNKVMLQIIDLMSISRPRGKNTRVRRISYSALGINQMGAVYEALLSYRGFFAEKTLFEVKRARDDFDELAVGYFVSEDQLDNYTEEERVRYIKDDPEGRYKKGDLRKYEKGTFIYRLAGREREKSASYYTPEVLTKCLVKYALKELLKDKTADEILNLTICEPAMGSAAFLNEAINQIAEAYLAKKQEELGDIIPFDKRFEKLQQVKMYIADRNVYGVDLNPIAVELAEVSLWLNTIYKGAYVPWFGTQIVCGNSLIGARRQVYYTSKLEKGKWYEEAPIRLLPGEKRKRTGVSNRVYHFLLGDTGMSEYKDSVIKKLEPDNLKKIKDWNKKFTEKYTESDISMLVSLSEKIDQLWEETVQLRKQVKEATEDSYSVYGHEVESKQRTTIREKDTIYHKIYKSEHMNNAGPYARLKAAMDYWCALWFWPIDKADLLPTRQEFFFDMNLILDGTYNTVQTTKSVGQMTLLQDDDGNVTFGMEGTQLELEAEQLYAGKGEVNLDALRSGDDDRSQRLRIVNEIAEQQRFLHWELEFADVFEENGGFDMVLGNPPWSKLLWEEKYVLSEYDPLLIIKEDSAKIVTEKREQIIQIREAKHSYFAEYQSMSGTQSFINSMQNYSDLKGTQSDLFRCFIPKSWELINLCGVVGYVHPDGIYDDPKGEKLRKRLYPKLKKHYQFVNQKKLFDIGNTRKYSLNIASNIEDDSFETIANLFLPVTIDECYKNDTCLEQGIKNSNGDWNISGSKDRIICICKDDMKLLAEVFGADDIMGAKLPSLHSLKLMNVLRAFYKAKNKLGDYKDEIICNVLWDETNDQKDGTIIRNVHFPENCNDAILSGSHIGVSNPLFQTSQRNCSTHRAFDHVDLSFIDDDYLQRCNYVIGDLQKVISEFYSNGLIEYYDAYKFVARRMLSNEGERTLMGAIIPPKVGHINGLIGLSFKNIDKLLLFTGMASSVVFDFYIKISGKANLNFDGLSNLPMDDNKYSAAISLRALLLNSVTKNYDELVTKFLNSREISDFWAKNDARLDNSVWSKEKILNEKHFFVSDYERRQALIELDVLTALSIGLNLETLCALYELQFPVLQQYEIDTWYDQKGRIVFTTNRSLTGVGFTRSEWEKIKDAKEGIFEQTIEDDTIPGGPVTRTIEYVAPFDKCDREKDYEEVWHNFEARFAK